MSANYSDIECQLIAGPFDGLTFQQPGATASIAVSLRQMMPTPIDDTWAIYSRSDPAVLLDDGTIEFLYEGTSKNAFG
jgi:hypothetical protein